MLMHTLLAAPKDPLAPDPPVANRPKKSKTKKAPIKAVPETIPVAPSVPSAHVITINKPTIPLQALKLPISPQISQALATTEAANIQASAVPTQSKKANETKRVTAKAAQGPQSPTGSESVTIQIKSPLKALNLPDIPQTLRAPLASESVASIKPKKASRIRPCIIPLRYHWLQTPATQLTTQGQITRETIST